MSVAFEVQLLEKLQRLLAEGSFTTTYKLAVLLGLVELATEAPEGTESFTTRQLAEKVAAIYWPQVLPLDDVALRHGAQGATIVTAVEALRRQAGTTLLSAARLRAPEAYEATIRKVELVLVLMPLPRLQELAWGRDEFLYRIGWTREDSERSQLEARVRAYQRDERGSGFDNRITCLPGVVPTLARFHRIVRELVESRWVRKVRDLNGAALRERDLQQHLFGFEREDLAPLARPLLALHGGRCFYCQGGLVRAHVDHFLPWARYPDNRLLNLVPAHDACNGSKSAHLAAVVHVDRWLERFTDRRVRDELAGLAEERSWQLGDEGTLAVGRVLYGQQPDGSRLWAAPGTFEPFRRRVLEARLRKAAERCVALG